MNDWTALIPYKEDSEQRKINYNYVKSFIKLLGGKVEIQTQSNNVPFWKTHLLNALMCQGKSKVVAFWDCDCFINIDQIEESIGYINDGYTMCYPYDKFLSVDNTLTVEYDMSPYKLSTGGIVFINRDKYLDIMENENFIGWGIEDDARDYVVKKLGHKVARIEGELYHINHPRSEGTPEGIRLQEANQREYRKMLDMTTEQLKEYVKNGYK